MSFLLQAQWVTQASDFLTQNGLKLFGILGGTSGVIALLTFIGRIVLVCVKGKIDKKNNAPLQASYKELKQDIQDMIELLKVLIAASFDDMKDEMKSYIKELLEKSQKMKMALYDKLITEGENAQELLDELNEKIEEAQALVEPESESIELAEMSACVEPEQVPEQDENTTQMQLDDTVEPTKKQKRKAKKIVVES